MKTTVHLQVYDGNLSNDLELGTWCGDNNITINTTGSQVAIRFRTDSSLNNKGFQGNPD